MTPTFFILAVLMLAGTVAAMTLRKLVHCTLALSISFVGLAGLYLELGAEFVGLVQVLVYVGAVVILIVFAILLTGNRDLAPQSVRTLSWRLPWLAGGVVAALVFAVLAWAVSVGGSPLGALTAPPPATIEQIGNALMHRFVLPLEVVGLLLTAALIGAVVIAMEEKGSAK